MNFFPHFPLSLSPFTLFGLTLLLGLIGGELTRRNRYLPTLLGYLIVGYLVGPSGFHLIDPAALIDLNIFVDIALGLILFELGKQMDFVWLRDDRGILPMAITEAGLIFLAIFILLRLCGMSWLLSTLGATIAMTTSPVIVMVISRDLSANGTIARRALILTSLNNFFALILFTLLLPFSQSDTASGWIMAADAIYRLAGSLLLGSVMFFLMKLIAGLIGKHKEGQFILLIASVVLTICLTRALNLSTLSVLVLGIAARNFDTKNTLMEIDFGWLMQLFTIILFVVTGIHLQFDGLWQAPVLVLAFIVVRTAAKTTGIYLFSKASRLTTRQTFTLSLAMSPMAGPVISLSNTVVSFSPQLNHLLTPLITSVMAVLLIVGAIATQVAFLNNK